MEAVKIRIEGMSCSHCEASVREVLETLPGVEQVIEVSAEAQQAQVKGRPDPALVAQRLEEIGFAGMVTDD
ncbi:heavy-metal-associated domain-containing protein [Halorhodospira halochloris]|uniref:Heavy metal binding protein n=1 Tax=Halorhodospira halochloris TaxID=1052 RepID=A0A0X8X7D3_HALHR|nr:heavy metal-associated domain-containing protein [Halorhodospira halochloris]MBK1652261.1 heavy metal transport/detoxification protein [Halorhodospira halochloris]MCG5530679.1 heavy-metal-associated domain-containing protein [Halorhodospira halochloris]MCG5548334.1 heavy-metal-associated domain-containing protein [Halorhodospira halochloris]BAU56945.1 heavy metal binding protein [Halorhodospira halochloris]